ncbi:MAG: hypothetical protein ACJ71R_12060, partial [Nitrososphaeraceae archaeon]
MDALPLDLHWFAMFVAKIKIFHKYIVALAEHYSHDKLFSFYNLVLILLYKEESPRRKATRGSWICSRANSIYPS